MKSAYEIAMGRLEKESPTAALTPAQKAEIAEIDNAFTAKIAEREVFLQGEIAKARARQEVAEVHELEQQLSLDVRRLREQCEDKKEKIRAKR